MSLLHFRGYQSFLIKVSFEHVHNGANFVCPKLPLHFTKYDALAQRKLGYIFRHALHIRYHQRFGFQLPRSTLATALHKGVFSQFPFRWIYYCHSSKSTKKETGKTYSKKWVQFLQIKCFKIYKDLWSKWYFTLNVDVEIQLSNVIYCT